MLGSELQQCLHSNSRGPFRPISLNRLGESRHHLIKGSTIFKNRPFAKDASFCILLPCDLFVFLKGFFDIICHVFTIHINIGPIHCLPCLNIIRIFYCFSKGVDGAGWAPEPEDLRHGRRRGGDRHQLRPEPDAASESVHPHRRQRGVPG